jgi:alpha-ketoglutarate-dependent taurine dioxygenase
MKSQIAIKPLQPGFAAEVGLDLSRPISAADGKAIRRAFAEHPVLVFRGQHDTKFERLGELAALFGEPGACGDITNLGPDGAIVDQDSLDARYTRGNLLWHMDMLVLERPPLGAMLLARELPGSGGGQTQFANLERALAQLPAERRQALDGLHAVHSLEIIRERMGITDPTEIKSEYAPGRHPLVVVDPVSNTRTLLFGAHTVGIDGLSEEAGNALMVELLEIATAPDNVYTHTWQVGELVMWSNRRLLHRVLPYENRREKRRLWRMEILADAAPQSNPVPRWRSWLPW